ncbi:Hypothetical protein A7982_08704 [Minicystis rosea]|nr:Hypothetical protein A7982_08704 [Minicystis rosea]
MKIHARLLRARVYHAAERTLALPRIFRSHAPPACGARRRCHDRAGVSDMKEAPRESEPGP